MVISKETETEKEKEKVIFDELLNNYIEGINKTIFLIEIVNLIVSSIVFYLGIKGIFIPQKSIELFTLSKDVYLKIQLCNTVFTWTVLGIYFLLFKRFSLEHRKKLLCVLIILLNFSLIFGNLNINFLGFLFVVPIVIAGPMNKNTNRVVFLICFIANIFYTVLQTVTKENNSNIFIGIVTTTSILSFYFISMKKHKIMYNGMLDIKQQYHSISQELYDEVSHDFLTKAYSLSAFHDDVARDHNYNSLAVIDIDNFKSINDKYGHECGDNVLKLLVSIFQINKMKIYRVGGDEFAILSDETPDRLATRLKKLKNDFTDGIEDHYSFRATISIGIINISNDANNFSKYFSECDRLMYESKEKGKNRIVWNDNFAV